MEFIFLGLMVVCFFVFGMAVADLFSGSDDKDDDEK